MEFEGTSLRLLVKWKERCNKRIYATYTKDWMEVEGKNYSEANTGCMVKEESSVYFPLQGKKVGGYTFLRRARSKKGWKLQICLRRG